MKIFQSDVFNIILIFFGSFIIPYILALISGWNDNLFHRDVMHYEFIWNRVSGLTYTSFTMSPYDIILTNSSLLLAGWFQNVFGTVVAYIFMQFIGLSILYYGFKLLLHRLDIGGGSASMISFLLLLLYAIGDFIIPISLNQLLITLNWFTFGLFNVGQDISYFPFHFPHRVFLKPAFLLFFILLITYLPNKTDKVSKKTLLINIGIMLWIISLNYTFLSLIALNSLFVVALVELIRNRLTTKFIHIASVLISGVTIFYLLNFILLDQMPLDFKLAIGYLETKNSYLPGWKSFLKPILLIVTLTILNWISKVSLANNIIGSYLIIILSIIIGSNMQLITGFNAQIGHYYFLLQWIGALLSPLIIYLFLRRYFSFSAGYKVSIVILLLFMFYFWTAKNYTRYIHLSKLNAPTLELVEFFKQFDSFTFLTLDENLETVLLSSTELTTFLPRNGPGFNSFAESVKRIGRSFELMGAEEKSDSIIFNRPVRFFGLRYGTNMGYGSTLQFTKKAVCDSISSRQLPYEIRYNLAINGLRLLPKFIIIDKGSSEQITDEFVLKYEIEFENHDFLVYKLI